MDLIPSNIRDSAVAALQNLYDSNSRDIIVYKTSQKTIISQNTNYNFAFGDNQAAVQIQDVLASGTFYARVHYVDAGQAGSVKKLDRKIFDELTELKMDMNETFVRLKVGTEAFEFLKDSSNVQFDNINYKLISNMKPCVQFGDIRTLHYILYLHAAQ